MNHNGAAWELIKPVTTLLLAQAAQQDACSAVMCMTEREVKIESGETTKPLVLSLHFYRHNSFLA